MKRGAALALAVCLVCAWFTGCGREGDAYRGADLYARTAASICGWAPDGSFFEGSLADDAKRVGLFYFNWLGQHPDEQTGIYDISALEESAPEAIFATDSDVSPMNEYHFWGQPLYGYYSSTDEWVIRKHVEMFVNAGIDFLGLDATNAVLYEDSYEALFSVLGEFRRQGFDYPRVTFLTNTSSRKTVFSLYETYYSDPGNDWLWLYEDGKPFIVLQRADFDLSDPAVSAVVDHFSYRHVQWPDVEPFAGSFPWMSYDYPQFDHSGVMSVSAAQQTAGAMSRSGSRGRGYDYAAGANTEEGIAACSNYRAQWATALADEDVRTVFLTGWNEWMALKLPDGDSACFIDQFDYGFSRDLEPSLREDGDAYYRQTVASVQAFKGTGAGVAPLKKHELGLEDDLAQLFAENRAARYADPAGDTAPRSHAGAAGGLVYTEDTGRNDIVCVNVANDRDSLYILVECAEEITAPADSRWLNIELLCGGETYTLNRAGTGVLSGGGQDRRCETQLRGNRFWVRVPREWLGEGEDRCCIRVRDNVDPDALLASYRQGDSAPLGDLYYSYRFA